MFDIRDPNMSYYELLDYCFNDYKREFGERKFTKIEYRIKTSSRIEKLINNLKKVGAGPGYNDLIYSINEIIYFTFARGQTQVIACLLALERWNAEANIPNDMKYFSYFELKERVLKIILKKKSQFW